MTGWLRLESRCAQWGWTGNLPATQFAAWIKLLCTVKVVGDRDGRVREDYFCDRILRAMRIPRTAWESMLAEAQKGGEQAAVQKNGPYLQIVAWRTYQPDPTALERQNKHRKGVVTGCHSDTALDTVSHDDVDVDVDVDVDKDIDADKTDRKTGAVSFSGVPCKKGGLGSFTGELPPYLEPYRKRTTARALKAFIFATKNRPRLFKGFIAWWFTKRWKPEKGSPLDGLKASDRFARAVVGAVNGGRRKRFEDLKHLLEQSGVAEEPLPARIVIRGESLDLEKLILVWTVAPPQPLARGLSAAGESLKPG